MHLVEVTNELWAVEKDEEGREQYSRILFLLFDNVPATFIESAHFLVVKPDGKLSSIMRLAAQGKVRVHYGPIPQPNI